MIDKKYQAILTCPRPRSATRPPMSLEDRAAQFAPFSALSGHAEGTEETARTTQPRRELSEDAIAQLNEQIQRLESTLDQQPALSVTYFVPDTRKTGGRYLTTAGFLKKMIPHPHRLVLTCGTEIFVQDIVSLESPIFD